MAAFLRSWARSLLSDVMGTPPPSRPPPSLSASALSHHFTLHSSALPLGLAHSYAPLCADADTQAFLDGCAPNWCADSLAYILRRFLSVTDTNALLRRGHMLVLTPGQAASLVCPHLREGAGRGGAPRLRLLDVGAGAGGATATLAAAAEFDVDATEVSGPMVRRLRERGYRVHHTGVLGEEGFPTPHVFDVVSIQNVLDRCDHPADLLRGAVRLLRPGGVLLLAVVLPFSEFVEDGTVRRAPKGALPMRGARCGDGASLEASLSALVTRVLWPLGLEVVRLARVPYLCSGDAAAPYYVLDDVILVCKVTPGSVDGAPWLRLGAPLQERAFGPEGASN